MNNSKFLGMILSAGLLFGMLPTNIQAIPESEAIENIKMKQLGSQMNLGVQETYLDENVLYSTSKIIIEDHSIVDGDVTLTVDLYDDFTATITMISNPKTELSYVFPKEIEYNDLKYTVNGLSLGFFSKECGNFIGIKLPDTLTKINASFKKFSNVKEIIIPGSVKVFDGDFQSCKNLEKIIFEEGVETITSNSMVLNCSSLKEIKLPSTLKYVTEPNTFGGASAIETIVLPEGIQINEGSTFKGNTSLKSIHLPASVSEITSSMFEGCTSLQSVSSSGKITEIGSYAFSDNKALAIIPDLSHVNEMGAGAFSNCNSLTSDIDLSSLNEIPDKAFFQTPISSVKFSDNLTIIGEAAFQGCNLSEITLPKTLQEIDYAAFAFCKLQGELNLPDSLTTLETYTFYYTTIESVKIGSGLKNIPKGTFEDCAKLTKVVFNNKEDDLTFGENALPAEAEVEYLIPSIGNVGDTISYDIDSPSLQAAIDQANDGTTIVISKDIKLSTPINIPTNKRIVLTSKEKFYIIANKDNALNKLITVSENASLTLAGELVLMGNNLQNGVSIIDCSGELILQNNATITRMSLNKMRTGVINVHGENAEFIMNGGQINENIIHTDYSGSVRVSEGANFIMNSGDIQNNQVEKSINTSSAGVYLFGDSYFEMNGGKISENSGARGSAVMLYSEPVSRNDDYQANFIMNGGEISNNIAVKVKESSGAVHIEGASSFTMIGGLITKNSGSVGGGICVVDSNLQRGGLEYRTAFIMNGGEISNNSAGSGGGIYSYTNGVVLNAGKIIDNKATQGGGIYSEGNKQYYSTLQINKALITGNAAEQGGGIWFCPTGEGKIHIANGAAIYNNTATGAGDDFAATANDKHKVTVANRALGGGSVIWQKDGAIFSLGEGTLTSVFENFPRFGDDNADKTHQIINDYAKSISLKSTINPSAIELAKSQATLIISGNEAVRGGGIGSNGGIEIGNSDVLKTILIKKTWSDNIDLPTSITLHIFADGYEIEKVVLTAENKWQEVLEGIPNTIENITVTEESIPNYDFSYDTQIDENGNYVINAMNTYTGNTDTGNTGTDSSNPDPSSAVWKPSAQKLVNGIKPQESNYTFYLKDSEGNIIQTKQNLEDKVNFDPISFSKSGTYNYYLEEKITDNQFMTYDKSVYQAEVVVTKQSNYIIDSVTWYKNGELYMGIPVFMNEINIDPLTKTLTVRKVWEDNGNSSRPLSIEVQLYKENEAFGSPIHLSMDNGWQYTWTDLDPSSNWSVDEVTEAANYKKSITNSGEEWTIVNTYDGSLDSYVYDEKKDVPDTNDEKLEWFVMLAFSGLVLMFFHLIRKRIYKL